MEIGPQSSKDVVTKVPELTFIEDTGKLAMLLYSFLLSPYHL